MSKKNFLFLNKMEMEMEGRALSDNSLKLMHDGDILTNKFTNKLQNYLPWVLGSAVALVVYNANDFETVLVACLLSVIVAGVTMYGAEVLFDRAKDVRNKDHDSLTGSTRSYYHDLYYLALNFVMFGDMFASFSTVFIVTLVFTFYQDTIQYSFFDVEKLTAGMVIILLSLSFLSHASRLLRSFLPDDREIEDAINNSRYLS